MKIQGKTAAEIFDCVRALLQSGQLRPGQALPPVRDLAVELDINRNTVAAAYKRLSAAGIAVTQGRLGTIIREPSGPGEQEGALTNTPLVDLASGNPNLDWLPDVSAAFSLRPYRPRLYGAPTVNPGLEDYARAWFAPDCPAPFEVNLTHGAVDAIERLLGSHLVAGDKVAVENPCFLSSVNMLRIAGLQAIGVPVDAEGMQAQALEGALAKGAQAVILTPRAHNPTGCSLSARRARALARVLAKYPHVMVIVDDHFALLSNAEYHSVLAAGAQRWALVRSLSKTLGPDVRVAMVASDPATSRQLRLRLASGTSWVSHLLQDMVEVTLGRPEVAKLMARAREDYVRRRQTLEDALREQGVPCAEQGDGLNLWIPVEGDDQAVALALAHRGWLVRHGDAFGVQDPVRGLRVTISDINVAQSRELARDIRDSL
ncbi:transcriptional regulator PtsJ [Achromobacter denitrificans]|uniref:MocR-like B6 salvage transcription factor PtsJ n=1 Tax=Achromobacter denitrificans TaxID=32002 RepID=UPI0012BE0186|nr:transcriptional regulator PtsJ [Achromobacter denitrificans]MDX3876936.1 transcriptional regulator PtsJ [Achromobacter sp.]MBV2159578.1 transcriptional regulator PtsJ [Achromobacter denitrificans]MDF3860918.1 transcriptional regulator PtsJ [Achromobacter denitrificans]MPT37966.1 transcriptional regulator PtsJ [Achromobacter sp.]WFC68933.1 transcriptional regulator PtsJ [Achromobacter denitrificans]